MALSTLLLCFVAAVTSAHGQSTEAVPAGFIDIDCGHAGEGYPEGSRMFSPDKPYIDTGVNKNVSDDFKRTRTNVPQRYFDLRSFPNGTRNCYTIPVSRDVKYLVRAIFMYGNYDGLNQPPEFDLYIGVNLWQRVNTVQVSAGTEVIAVAPADSMQVCLVKSGTGTPFISMLQLRPLDDSMYPLVNASQSLVLLQDRCNYGGQSPRIGYPDDPYDRLWYKCNIEAGWEPLSSDSAAQVKLEPTGDFFRVPPAVMRTAVTASSLSGRLTFTVDGSHSNRMVAGSLGDKNYVTILHFAELLQLRANESRVFDVYANSTRVFEAYRPAYLQASALYTDNPVEGGRFTYSLAATADSTLPPILNAVEVHTLQRMAQQPTDAGDVITILDIKEKYKVVKNWEGDPCAPQQFMWEGLNCSFDASPNTRIISLNLSHSGLAGGILASIANLTALKSLDLSHNNLTGEIPEYLGKLSALNFLNLTSNQLTGSIPQSLANKLQDGSLSLSTGDNPDLCNKAGSCEPKKKKNIIVPIIIAASVSLVLLLAILILVWHIRRARTQETSTKQLELFDNHRQKDNLQTHSHHFTFSEILSITNNFEREIGKGGFGVVYLGYLPDKTQVAVKLLSQSSSQGAKEFRSEAIVLTRVHHKNLVSLLGYCNDKNNLALVYEFMPQGSLASHLYGNPDTVEGLSWRMRLTIALDSAQGLDYLHNGCKPSIVHRDVKTTNILLNENFGAKLADFGLSRAFINEEDTHLSTAVAGTPGYLDPEYYRTSQLKEKSDIYSFGVVLLELITGRTPIFGGVERIHITQWVLSRIEEGDIDGIADQRLQRNYDTNSIWKAVDVAMACASSPSTQRPTMSEVVVQLKECLALEARRSYSGNFREQSPEAVETLTLILDSTISPSAR